MSAMSSILRWLDGESPGSSAGDDSQVKVDDIPNDDARLQTATDQLPDDAVNNSVHADHSSVMAIEADLMEVSTKAVNAVRDWGNYLFSLGKLTSEHVSKTAMQLKSVLEDKVLIADTADGDSENVNGSEMGKTPEIAVAPWVGCNEEETVREQILALSKDKRNFTRPPPASSQFFFNYDVNYPVALVMLNEDPDLTTMRFELVPKHLREETFWRNYFYRVSLVKQSVQLTSLAKCSAVGLRSEPVTADATVQPEPGVVDNELEQPQPVTSYNPDTDITLSVCEYTPAEDMQPYELDAEHDDIDFEFVTAADITDCGNG